MIFAVAKKVSKVLFRGAAIAVATRVGLMILQKINKDGQLETKANAMIDKNAEKAKNAAKVGVSKSLHMSEVAQGKLEAKTSKTQQS